MAYLLGLVGIQMYTSTMHPVLFGANRLEFLPLLLTSVYCAMGIMYGWAMAMYAYLSQ